MGLWDMPAKHEICDTELRFNPYHDPTNGRFTSGSGGAGGGYLYVGKGQKGKGAYVFERDIDAEYEKWQKNKAAKSYDYSAKSSVFSLSKKGRVEISTGYSPSLPKIEGASEKQIKYASDLRDNFITGRVIGANKTYSDFYEKMDFDDSKVKSALNQMGLKNMDEWTAKYVESDSTMKYLLTEKSARNIIDKLR